VTVAEIISQVLAYTDNTNPSDADNSDRRTRLLFYLREILAEVWYNREWPFSRREVVLTVGAGDAYATAPDDFLALGEYGSILLADPQAGAPLENVPEYQIVQARQTSLTTESPEIFSIFDQDPVTFAPRIQFPNNNAAFDIVVSYLKKAPEIDESANNTAISEVPEQYHQTVLVPGLRARSTASKGDARWNEHQGIYLTALNWMKAKERRRQGTIWQMPSFFGNRRGGRA
jgi:hypothetical protein